MTKTVVYLGTIVLAGLFLSNGSAQGQSSREVLIRGMAVLTDGASKRDYNQILEGREIMEQVPEDDSLAIWAHYYAAAASSDLANMIREEGSPGGKKEIAAHLNNAIKHLETAVKIDPTFADGWMLLSSAYVHKINVRPFKALRLSRKYRRARSKAVELEPMNPRVKLMKGIIDYELPAFVGGDKKLAEKEMNEALLIFSEEVIDHPFRPSWGHDQVYARLGIIYMDRGDLEDARAAFSRSLELNPDYGWVKQELIPSLEKLESEASND